MEEICVELLWGAKNISSRIVEVVEIKVIETRLNRIELGGVHIPSV